MAKIFGGLRGSRFPLATNYEDQGPDEIVFPEDLAALDDAGVDSLLNGALEAFQDIYGDGTNLSDAQVDALSALTEGITRVKGEKDARTAASAERSASAAALAEQARSEEHTSELQSLMRISYDVFCLKNNKQPYNN